MCFLKPSESLKYATLGLLFVNISVGGVLTQFASPPVVIVASVWNWNLVYMLTHFGWKAVIGFILSNSLYLTVFRREFARIAANVPDKEQDQEGRRPIPWHPYSLSLLDSSERPLCCPCDLRSSFLSCVRFSLAAEPARDCAATTVTRRLLPCGPNHSRRVPAMVDRTSSRELE
jgi:hypothetical protein